MSLTSKILERLKVYKGWWELAGFFVVMIGLVVGFNNYLDWKIDQKLSDEALLRKIGMTARPFCIFNSKGGIRFDSGAMQFIGDPSKPGKDCFDFADFTKEGFPQQITVHFNHLFTYAPILTVTGMGLTSTSAKQGSGYDWVYTIYWASALAAEEGKTPPPTDEQDYRLEILF